MPLSEARPAGNFPRGTPREERPAGNFPAGYVKTAVVRFLMRLFMRFC